MGVGSRTHARRHAEWVERWRRIAEMMETRVISCDARCASLPVIREEIGRGV